MTLTVDLHKDGAVSVVTLNRPQRLNAMNAELLRELCIRMDAAQANPDTRTIVLTGAGRAFCAGDDLKEFEQQSGSAAAVAQTREDIQRVTRSIMGGAMLAP